MTILHNQCLPTELEKPANQAVIAATFADCSGTPLTPGTQLATCNDIPAIPAAQTLSLAGQSLTLSGGGGTVTLPDSDDQTLSITGNVLAISGGNSVTLPTAPASALAIQDEAAALGNAGTLNFVGPGVTASVSGGVATVNIPGATASTPVGVQDEGAVVVASPTAVNFVGTGVTVTNAAGVATVNIPGGSIPPAASACETPVSVFGQDAGGAEKAFAWAAMFSTSTFVQSASAYTSTSTDVVTSTQINNPHTCRAMNVLATAIYSIDYGLGTGYADTHFSFNLNTTAFAAPSDWFTEYHDENKGGHHSRSQTRAISVPAGGSAYFSTVGAYAAGSSATAVGVSHVLFGVTE